MERSVSGMAKGIEIPGPACRHAPVDPRARSCPANASRTTLYL